jgi:membrane protein
MSIVLKLARLTWREVLCAIWQDAFKANIANHAAELAFWFLLGFFPMLMCVTSVVSRLSSAPDSQAIVMQYMGEVFPSAASNLVQQVLAQTAGGGRVWFTLLFALWSASSATTGLIDTLNQMYDLKESRPWWKTKLLALSLAVALGVLLTAVLVIVLYGPPILSDVLSSSSTFYIWKIAQWPAAALLLILALLGLYHFAPDTQGQRLKWVLPGSIFAAMVWMVVSVLFKMYVRHFSHFGLLYGSLGTLVILMFWFYLSSVVILAGGQINAILEDVAARHMVPGAKRRRASSLAKLLD